MLNSSKYRRLTQARSQLQRLVPSRQDVHNIAQSAGPWLQIYHALFPTSSSFILTFNDLTDKYDFIMSPDADPLALTSFLVSLALTVLQIRNTASETPWKTIGLPSAFIRTVIDVVQATVFTNDELSATLEGIQSMILHSRL